MYWEAKTFQRHMFSQTGNVIGNHPWPISERCDISGVKKVKHKRQTPIGPIGRLTVDLWLDRIAQSEHNVSPTTTEWNI